MKEEEVLKCQVQEWYPRYKSVSIATELHKLPESFVSYLLHDEFILPASSNALPTRLTPETPELQAENYEKWEEEDEADDDEQDGTKTFAELEAAVEASIHRLGGSVMPKLNWSAPKDSVWISSSKNLRCRNFGEVCLLLKASDSVVHDLCHAFDNCEDKSEERPHEFVLALRKWYDHLRPEMEFRAFVRGGLLLGICQREVTGFYASLLGSREVIETAIVGFFKEKLSSFGLDDYTFDVYVTKDLRVKLLDFNPWGGSTLPLLFAWEELEQKFENVRGSAEQSSAANGSAAASDRPRRTELRIVESEGLVQPNLAATSGVPLDYVDTGPGSAWEVFFKRVDEEMKAQA